MILIKVLWVLIDSKDLTCLDTSFKKNQDTISEMFMTRWIRVYQQELYVLCTLSSTNLQAASLVKTF